MIKRFVKKIFRILLVIAVVLLIAGTVGFGIAFFNRDSELKKINELYKEVETSLNRTEQEKELTINDLQESFVALNRQVELLRSENKALKKENEDLTKTDLAKISGNIATVVTNETSFTQYQLVCAENSENSSLKWCISTSAINGKYSLSVPAGRYKIYAQIITTDGGVSNTKAYYTELVKCSSENSADSCQPSLAGKPVVLDATAGAILENVNPIDWSI